jgi:hypothetical protein
MITGFVSILVAGNRLFGHYFQLVIYPLTIFAFVKTYRLIHLYFYDKYISKKLIFIPALIVIAITIIPITYTSIRNLNQVMPLKIGTYFQKTDDSKVKLWLNKYHLKDKVMFGGSSQTYYYYFQQHVPVGRMIMTEIPFLPNHDIYLEEFMSAYQQNKPQAIVIPKDSWLLEQTDFTKLLAAYQLTDESSSLFLYLNR